MNKIRLAGWLAVGGLLGAALLAPSAALATDLHASQQGTAWNDQEFQGSAADCDGLELGPGDVVWHFVLTSPDADSGHLTATFDKAGDKTVENADSPAAILHFYVWTGHDTLLDAETTDVDGNLLNLSHICAGKEVESESVPVETASVPVETASPSRSRPSRSPSRPRAVPVETATVPGRDRDASPAVTPCADCTPATHGVPEGSVEAATGTPKEDVTPPSTDTLTPADTRRPTTAGSWCSSPWPPCSPPRSS